MAQYNTQQFTNQIRRIIERGETSYALEMLVYSLPENNIYRNDFISLLSEYEELKRYELLGLTKDTERMQRIRFATLEFLQNLEKNYYPVIELSNVPDAKPLQPKKKPVSSRPKKRSTVRSPKPLPIESIKKNVQIHINRLILYGLLFIMIIGFVYVKCFRTIVSAPVQSQFLTSEDGEAKYIGLAILLNQFERFEDADTERKEYRKKNISVLQIKGDTKPFKTVIIAERNLDKILNDVQKTWPQATVNNYGVTCPTFRYEKSVSVYICNN